MIMKKAAVLLLSAALFTAFLPMSAFAASESAAEPSSAGSAAVSSQEAGQQVKSNSPAGIVLSKDAVKSDDSDEILDFYRELLLEYFEEDISYAISESGVVGYIDKTLTPESSYYRQIVWEHLEPAYNESLDTLTNADELTDLFEQSEEDPSLMVIKSSLLEQMNEAITMAGWTKIVVRTNNVKKEVQRLRKREKTYEDLVCESLKESDYTQYYWGVVRSKKAEVASLLRKMKDIPSAAKNTVQADSIIGELDGGTSMDLNEISDYYGITIGLSVYTRNDVNLAKKEEKIYLDNALDNLIGGKRLDKKYQDPAEKILQKYKNEVDNAVDVNDILSGSYVEQYLEEVGEKYEVADVDYASIVSASDMFRWQKSMYQWLYDEIDLDKYESAEVEKISILIQSQSTKAYRNQIAVSDLPTLTEKTQKLIRKVKTRRQKIAAARSTCLAKLRRYTKKKGYDHSKALAVYRQAKAAMSKAGSTSKIRSLYRKYSNKMKTYAVKRFRISTSRYGKGSITKSKKIAYGKSFTVKLLPAAGWKISRVKIDGKTVKLKNRYVFRKVRKKHTVTVWYSK